MANWNDAVELANAAAGRLRGARRYALRLLGTPAADWHVGQTSHWQERFEYCQADTK
jgi:hypothetical protein